jgi:phosphate transport system substrate-binding protein
VRFLPPKFALIAIGALVCAGALCEPTSLCAAPAAAVALNGAGATFPAPLFKAWIERFQKDRPGVAMSYQSVGSGEGLSRFTAGVTDFAASDVAAPTTGVERSEGVGAQLPVTAGMVALAYNLPGVAGQLRLPRNVYTDIFLGRVTRWDDPRIAAANPTIRLPARPIAVIGRKDSSGTTFAFTSHLAAVSPAWSEGGPGVGKMVSWPTGVTLAPGNEGVAGLIKSREGAIGYVEHGFAKRLGLAVAALENKTGVFVAPSREAGAAAISQSSIQGLEELKASILDPTGADAYPIVSYSWLILHWDYPNDQLSVISAFVDYVLGDGQKIAADLGYIPLPPAVAHRGKAVTARIFPRESEGSSVATANPGGAKASPDAPSAHPDPATASIPQPAKPNSKPAPHGRAH